MTFARTTLIGESFVGDGPNAAHTNLVLGRKGGPVETAWATALATPSAGHVPFVTVLRPSVPVKPLTLFVTKAAASGDLHERATWGSAQAGLAQGVADALGDGLIPAADADDLLIIAAIWVNPAVDDLDESFGNQRAAAYRSIEAAVQAAPSVDDVLAAARQGAANPFYQPTEEALVR
ncbi:MAG: aldehyde-activating protein [Amycolatopsis sp.]|jgi:5,6,7,8-tetrahydromethanopterin hydro-lyase|uniref:formaldehyde-activating enzyme n=1 Tax=Amycolatopsis sp. TaxID=37632 RepID=UPI00261CF8AB|nr:formaldehyde-activating enzyme [Amycolatopsis sp.]MCU1684487.1 aldehyde-activating protein [Amycolatopsis sp.]